MNSNFAVQPPAVAESIMRAMPQAVQVGSFGMTETAGTVCTGSPDEPEHLRITRLGKPLPGLEVRIVPPDRETDAGVGEHGEVLVRGYSVLEGYHKDPGKTAQAIDEDGWFHTGDIGSLDEHGTIMFHGRYKDMLKVGGENVAAAEIEALLARHAAVKAGPGRRYSRSEVFRGSRRVRRVEAGRERDIGGALRLLQARGRRIQGAPRRTLRLGVADVVEQDPEIPPARESSRRAQARLEPRHDAAATALRPHRAERVRGARHRGRGRALEQQDRRRVRSISWSTSPSAPCIFAAPR